MGWATRLCAGIVDLCYGVIFKIVDFDLMSNGLIGLHVQLLHIPAAKLDSVFTNYVKLEK